MNLIRYWHRWGGMEAVFERGEEERGQPEGHTDA